MFFKKIEHKISFVLLIGLLIISKSCYSLSVRQDHQDFADFGLIRHISQDTKSFWLHAEKLSQKSFEGFPDNSFRVVKRLKLHLPFEVSNLGFDSFSITSYCKLSFESGNSQSEYISGLVSLCRVIRFRFLNQMEPFLNQFFSLLKMHCLTQLRDLGKQFEKEIEPLMNEFWDVCNEEEGHFLKDMLI